MAETLFGVASRCIHTITDDMISPAAAATELPPPLPMPVETAQTAPQPAAVAAQPAPAAAPAPAVAKQAVKPAAAKEAPAAKPQEKDLAIGGKPQSSLRVNVGLLDTLMNLAGELVLSRNQLLQGVNSSNAKATELSSQRIDMITSELQEAIMRTRMQPIANILNKFTRVVRDLSHQLGKTIELEIEGKDVELDKTILESINDPLTHLVRNSVDHGIETPMEREQMGKKGTGKIILKAFTMQARSISSYQTMDGDWILKKFPHLPLKKA